MIFWHKISQQPISHIDGATESIYYIKVFSLFLGQRIYNAIKIYEKSILKWKLSLKIRPGLQKLGVYFG